MPLNPFNKWRSNMKPVEPIRNIQEDIEKIFAVSETAEQLIEGFEKYGLIVLKPEETYKASDFEDIHSTAMYILKNNHERKLEISSADSQVPSKYLKEMRLNRIRSLIIRLEEAIYADCTPKRPSEEEAMRVWKELGA